MVKKILDLSKLTVNMINNYGNTEFYPRSYTLANGEVNVMNTKNQVVTILISIIKVNQTHFSSLFEIVNNDKRCRELFKDDTMMENFYQETLDAEEYCVTLTYCLPNRYYYHPYSYISKESIDKINEFNTDPDFNKELQEKINELIRICDQLYL